MLAGWGGVELGGGVGGVSCKLFCCHVKSLNDTLFPEASFVGLIYVQESKQGVKQILSLVKRDQTTSCVQSILYIMWSAKYSCF